MTKPWLLSYTWGPSQIKVDKTLICEVDKEVSAHAPLELSQFALLHAVRFHNLYFCAFCDNVDPLKYIVFSLILQYHNSTFYMIENFGLSLLPYGGLSLFIKHLFCAVVPC